MASFYGYFDESGKYKDHKVVSFCGLCASISRSTALDQDWNYWLRHFGLSALTMKRALNHRVNLSTRVAHKGINARTNVLLNFVECIMKHAELIIGIAIDVPAFEWLSPETKRLLGKDPQYMAFSRAISDMTKYIPNGSHGSIICDDEEQFGVHSFKLYCKLRRHPKALWGKLTSISFANDDAYPMLQAADMISSITRLEARRRYMGETYEYEQLFEAMNKPHAGGPIFSGGFFGKDELRGLAGEIIAENRKLKGKAVPLAE